MNQIQEIILKNKITELTKQKKYAEAEQVCIKLCNSSPNDLQVRFALAQLQQRLGKLKQAANSYLTVAKSKSEMTVHALTQALDISLQADLVPEGLMAAQELVQHQPKSPRINYLLGFFASRSGRDYVASVYYKIAIDLDPAESSFRVYYAKVLSNLGRIDEAQEQFEFAKTLDESSDEPYYRGLLSQNYSLSLDETSIYKSHLDYGKRLESRTPDVEPFEPRDPSQRIKVAYVSKDFVRHSVAYFFFPIIRNHNSSKFEIFCYSDATNPDEFTEIIKDHSEHWRDCHSLSDDELYQLIRNDKIDILVDLTGVTGVPRMGVYAKKAAPIQVNYLGYANTSGLTRMDYRISDEWADPVGLTEHFHTEELIRLPSGFLCYSPPSAASNVAELPALETGYITFGSFNFFPKINSQVIDAWIKILLQVPNSKLCIKSRYFNEPENTDQITATFAKDGIGKERLIFKTQTRTVNEHLKSYDQVDIHLDTFPYNGTTTTCEALWQGVPSITFTGNSHRSRVGNSIMSQVGIEDFIASDIETYISVAVAAANNIEKLAVLRKGMREKLSQSLLMDEKLFIQELETEYKKIAL